MTTEATPGALGSNDQLGLLVPKRDLLERLRSRAWEDRYHRKYREEAAREIERLREALSGLVRRYQENSHAAPIDEANGDDTSENEKALWRAATDALGPNVGAKLEATAPARN